MRRMGSAMLMRRACALALVFAASASMGAGAEWPQWRGPNRDGKSPDRGLLKEWPAEGPRLLWKASGIGKGFSSVAVAGGAIYTCGDIGEDLVITALDMNGTRKWQTRHDGAWKKNHPGSRSTPAIDDGRLYILSGHGLVGCYDARTGAKKWTVEVKSTFGGRVHKWGYSESVLVYENLAVVTPGGQNCIVALDKLTGRTVWTSKGLSDPAHYSSCIAFSYGNVPMIAVLTGRAMVCVSASTGQFLWRNDRAAGKTAVCPTPVYSEGYVFGASGYGNGGACVKLQVSGGGVSAKQEWDTKDMVCHHGGYVVVDGYIYGNHGGGWNCLDLKTGEKKWGAKGVGKGSVCYADGMLYTYGESGGKIGLVHATPEGFKPAGEFSVQGRGRSWAYPVVVGGRLYLRYGDSLYAFDVRGPDYRPPAARRRRPEPAAVSRPKPQPKPRPRPRPRPKTSDEEARRLWGLARNFLINDMTSLARAKLNDLIEKYPETRYATMAREKLRELQ